MAKSYFFKYFSLSCYLSLLLLGFLFIKSEPFHSSLHNQLIEEQR